MFQMSSIKNYIKSNKFTYFAIILLYIAGFTIGGVYSNFINEASFQTSFNFTKEFFRSLLISNNAIDIKSLIISDITPIIIIALSGVFLIGLPLIVFFIFKSGFSLGFYISFLIKAFALKGFYLGMFYLFINLIFALPAISAIAVNSIDLNLYIIGSVNKKYTAQRNFSYSLIICVFLFVICTLAVILGTNLKAVILPSIVRFLFSSVL